MTVLVYGKWPEQSQNIKSFFTASYEKAKIQKVLNRSYNSEFNFLFVGSLVSGKRPLYAVKLVEKLIKSGVTCYLRIYGDGEDRKSLEEYIEVNSLKEFVKLFGNQTSETIENAYREAQFLILPSKSEGWPKVVAEAMFWGVIPIVTKISCVPWMLGHGSRGILLSMDLEKDALNIEQTVIQDSKLENLSEKAKEWSQEYTLDYFELEIKSLVS
jgi:glycosyltransferase involved in cell wall biosynthesis